MFENDSLASSRVELFPKARWMNERSFILLKRISILMVSHLLTGCLSTTGGLPKTQEQVSLLLGGPSNLRTLSMVPGRDGSVYVAGLTQSSFGGQSLRGDQDVYVAHLSSDKSVNWVRFFGTNGITSTGPRNLIMDQGGDLWLAGTTTGSFPGFKNLGGEWSGFDPFLVKLSSQGKVHWINQHVALHDTMIQGLSADPQGGIVITGWTKSSKTKDALKNPSGFVAKIDSRGNQTQSFLIDDEGLGSYGKNIVLAQNGDIFVGGSTFCGLAGYKNQGGVDTFLLKLDSKLEIQWTTMFGGSSNDIPFGNLKLTADGSGVFISGVTGSSLFGKRAFGGTDSYVGRFQTSSGARDWFRQMGTSSEEDLQGVELFSDDQIIVVGGSHRKTATQEKNFFDLNLWRINSEDGQLLKESHIGSLGDGAFVVQLYSDLQQAPNPIWKVDL